MSVESYITHMAQAGISRGQFETHFKAWDASSVSSLHQSAYDESVPLGWKPPPLEEDLSYLNSPFWKRSRANGSQGGTKAAKARRKPKKPKPCTAMVKWVKAWEPA